jgi:4-amino-4-deoxychorismate lyase
VSETAAWINGAPASDLAFSRGLHYGDGVFRTLLKFNSQIIDFEHQYLKISDDAQALGLDVPSAVDLLAEAGKISSGQASCVIKILLVRAGAGRGYRPQTAESDRLLFRFPLPPDPAGYWSAGIEAFRCGLVLAEQPALAGIKHLNRLEQVLAGRDWRAGAQEGILCDSSGAPVCGTRSNLFWLADGILHTPELKRCGVAGMMRGKLLACAESLGLPVRIGSWTWEALVGADEAFVSNSLIGLWPLQKLENRRWDAPGPQTRRLSAALGHPRTR